YRCLRKPRQPCYANRRRLSVAGVADQRLSRPEQDHQDDPDHPEHCKYRLVEHDLDDAAPEPGRLALDPGPECRLARLVHVVPELAETGEPQVLVGHPARPVIDHEDESASQQQQPHQAEETADHVSPTPVAPQRTAWPYRAVCGNSTSSVLYRPFATAL